MAHHRAMDRLVGILQREGVIQSDEVAQVMRTVDRGQFCPYTPYHDSPQDVGYNATISAPHVHAFALEFLLPLLKPGSHVLDVGSGCGYLCACFAELVKPHGVVVGVEHVPELVELSHANLMRGNQHYLESGVIKLVCGDGRKGYAPMAPFDAIHVGAAVSPVPKALIDQLKPGGRMVVPVSKHGGQTLQIIHKDAGGALTVQDAIDVAYVPLTSLEYQLAGFRG